MPTMRIYTHMLILYTHKDTLNGTQNRRTSPFSAFQQLQTKETLKTVIFWQAQNFWRRVTSHFLRCNYAVFQFYTRQKKMYQRKRKRVMQMGMM